MTRITDLVINIKEHWFFVYKFTHESICLSGHVGTENNLFSD